jgi:hypothetical protein
VENNNTKKIITKRRMKNFSFIFGSVEKHWWWVALKNTIFFKKNVKKFSREMDKNKGTGNAT